MDWLKHTLRVRHDFGLDGSTAITTLSLPQLCSFSLPKPIFMNFDGPQAQP